MVATANIDQTNCIGVGCVGWANAAGAIERKASSFLIVSPIT